MRLLDRYLVRELMIPFGYCLSGFLVFWISFDLMSDLNEFQSQQVSAAQIALYYMIKLPEMLVMSLPIAFLLALLYAMSNHGRHNELVAIRVAGIGLFRLGLPYLVIGFCLSLLSFALNELLVPDSAEAGERIINRKHLATGTAKDPEWRRNLNFLNQREDRIWNIGAYNKLTFEMLFPQIDSRLPDGSRYNVFAERAYRTNDSWAFVNVQEWTNQVGTNQMPAIHRTPLLVLEYLDETPEVIQSEIKISSLSNFKAARKIQLSLSEIFNYRRLHPTLERRDTALLDTQMHGRLATPWTCFIVVLIALPLGAASSGRRNVFAGVANSIFICFAYFILLRLGLVLGTSGFMVSWLAAWLPNLFFGGLGLILLWRNR